MDAATVKQLATDLGADQVGIASARTLNAFPPDPLWPQTPDRISPYCRSVIVIALAIPVAVFRAKLSLTVQYMDQAVLRRLDKISHRLARRLEAESESDWPLASSSFHRGPSSRSAPAGRPPIQPTFASARSSP